jgi:hypothetical protein
MGLVCFTTNSTRGGCFLIYLLCSAVILASVFQNLCRQLGRSLPIARWATTTRNCKDNISSWFRRSFPSHFSTSFVNNMGMRANKEASIQRNQMLFGFLLFGALQCMMPSLSLEACCMVDFNRNGSPYGKVVIRLDWPLPADTSQASCCCAIDCYCRATRLQNWPSRISHHFIL